MAFLKKLMFWTKRNKKPACEQYLRTNENFSCVGSYRLLSPDDNLSCVARIQDVKQTPEVSTQWAPALTKCEEDAQIGRRSQTGPQDLDMTKTAVVCLPYGPKGRRVKITSRLLWSTVRACYCGPALIRVTDFYSPAQLKGLQISSGAVQHAGAITMRNIQTKEHQRRVNGQQNQAMEKEITETTGTVAAPFRQKKVAARKACIMEIIETEETFGNDLRIIVKEFYNPIMQSGLLKRQHLDGVFLNVEDLLIKSKALLEKLKAVMSAALQQGDVDLLSVDMEECSWKRQPCFQLLKLIAYNRAKLPFS